MPGEMRPPGVDNPHGPGKCTEHDRERTDKHAGARIQGASAHQEADAAESQKNSGQKRGVQAPLPGGDSGEQENPDGLAGNEQRGKARRYFLLRPVKRAVADEKEKYADDDAGANLRPGRPQSFSQAPDEENRARYQVAKARGVERGNRFHGVTNREVRGTPDEVDGEKGKDDGSALQARARGGYNRWDFFNDCRGFHGHPFTNEQRREPRYGAPSSRCRNALSLLYSLP